MSAGSCPVSRNLGHWSVLCPCLVENVDVLKHVSDGCSVVDGFGQCVRGLYA